MVVDLYQVLSISRDASRADIKAAYHRALLTHHPDKQKISNSTQDLGADIPYSEASSQNPSVSDIRHAYAILSDHATRLNHNAELAFAAQNGSSSRVSGSQRPAEVVSLEEFEFLENEQVYTHSCRCGSLYRVSEFQLDADTHLIGCQGCSEVIWVGYEAVEE